MENYTEDLEPAFKRLADTLCVDIHETRFDYNRAALIELAVERLNHIRELGNTLYDVARAIHKNTH